jgi:Rieske Fe-S protein
MSEPNRRAVLQGAAVAGVAGVAGFVAFSLRDEEAADPAYTEDDAASNGQGTVLAAVDDIPDGGGVIVQDANVVVTRDGSSIQAFSAVCTHQGCTVASVQDGRISCACHGSVFDSGTGAVLQGPAQRPLAPVEVGLVDGSIVTV